MCNSCKYLYSYTYLRGIYPSILSVKGYGEAEERFEGIWNTDKKIASNSLHQVPSACSLNRILVPHYLTDRLISWVDTTLAMWSTYSLQKNHDWWPNMITGIHRFVCKCTVCVSMLKYLTLSQRVHLCFYTLHWSTFWIGFITDLPESRSKHGNHSG